MHVPTPRRRPRGRTNLLAFLVLAAIGTDTWVRRRDTLNGAARLLPPARRTPADETYYVGGAVERPGVYPLGNGLTKARAAVEAAGRTRPLGHARS